MPPCEVIAITRRRLVVEHEAQRVGVMDRDVQHDAAAGVGLLDPPSLQMGGQIDGVEHPREQRLADPPLLDRVAHRAVSRRIAQMMVGAQDHAALAAFGDHRARVGKRSAPAASRTARACRRRPRRRPGRDAARWSSRCRPRRRPSTRPASSRLVVAWAMPCFARVFRRAIRVRAHDGDGFAAVGAERADHVLGGDRAGADQSPTESGHRLRSSLERGSTVPQDARMTRLVGHSTASGSKSPLASWRISSWAAREPRLRRVDRDARQGGQRVLGLFDVVEADHGEFPPDRDAGLGQRANEADRDDVVETKGGGRGLVEVEQLRNRRRRRPSSWSSFR